jgi:hypothetical protein
MLHVMNAKTTLHLSLLLSVFLEGICSVQRYEPPAADWKDHAIAGFTSGAICYTALGKYKPTRASLH